MSQTIPLPNISGGHAWLEAVGVLEECQLAGLGPVGFLTHEPGRQTAMQSHTAVKVFAVTGLVLWAGHFIVA